MRLSVIIPVYNSEATLLRCVISVEKALEKNYQRYLIDGEIILINDGSMDKSLSMCKALAKKYRNILVLSQKNKGVAAARNQGLMAATGDFIAFVDADDAVGDRYFLNLYSEMKTDTALVISKPNKITADMQETRPIIGKEDKLRVIDTPWDAMDDFFGKNELSAVWGKLFRKKYVKELFNESLQVLEDMCFLADYLSIAKGAVKIIPEKQYMYYMKEDSKISFEKFEMMKTAYQYVAEKMKEAGCKYSEDLKIKYIKHFTKNFLKLSVEEQESEAGQIALETFRNDSKEIANNFHMKITDRILYMGLLVNPEVTGNIVKQGRNSMYKLSRTIN